MSAVLHLLNSYLPATETFIWQYLRQAKRFPPCILADKYEFLDRFPLPGGDNARLYLPPHRPAWHKGWSWLIGQYAPVSYSGLESALAGRDVALIHAHQGFRACITVDTVKKLGLPLVVSFYGSDVSRRDVIRRAKRGYAKVFREAGALLAEGPALSRRLIELGAPESKVKAMPLAIDLHDYPFHTRQWDGKRPIRLLFVGRLVEKKGLLWGLRAMALAMKMQGAPEFHLTVVGDGPLGPSLLEITEELGMRDKVRFAGTLPLSALRHTMTQQDALLAPSCRAKNGDSEGGAPTVLLEAQACGLPVVATTHDDIPFTTLPGQSALLVPEKDFKALAEALLTLANRASSWGEMGKAGRNFVAQNHDARLSIESMEKIYAGLV